MKKLIAITREVSPAIGRCELTFQERQPIDLDLARLQHREYESCLAGLGCRVSSLPAEPELPDSVFVEDTAVVLDEVAIITRPGALSRRPETGAIVNALGQYRQLRSIQAPGTLEGGDVLCLGKRLFVGVSSRTNRAGIDQLQMLVQEFGYTVTGVPVGGSLHLKSAVTRVGKDILLINRDWVDAGVFGPVHLVDVDPAEPSAANALLIDDIVIYPTSFPGTRRRLESHDIRIRAVEASELAKAEGGVTCCSLIFPDFWEHRP